MKKDDAFERCINNLNLGSFQKLGEAISKAQNDKIEMGKELILAKYSETHWIIAIKNKDWKKITKMYNRTKFGVMIKFVNIYNKMR